MEPLKVLEIDARGGEVQIRSQSPVRPRRPARLTTRSGCSSRECCAWNVIVVDDATRQRRRTPCQFTREVLERLADDIAASAWHGSQTSEVLGARMYYQSMPFACASV